MSIHLRRDLDGIKRGLLTMGALVEEATNRAILSLVERRPELAAEVLTGDDTIDAHEVALEEECLKLLALHQPVATDLRFIVTTMKVNNDLERMGDLAINIAERAQFLASQPPLPLPVAFDAMAERVRAMLRQSLDALVNLDADAARRVLPQDDDVDGAHRAMFGACAQLMKDSPDHVERAIATISASRNLERIADLATNIAEDVVFLVEGEVIRHRYTAHDSADD